jgi:hypothetical protein
MNLLLALLYGERLQLAMDRRGEITGHTVSRKDVAKVADCAVQNIGMILNDAKGRDQHLGAEAHLRVAALLKVNPEWLATGAGSIDLPAAHRYPGELTPAAVELAALFDMLPATNRVARAQAFNAATTAIMQVLQAARATP